MAAAHTAAVAAPVAASLSCSLDSHHQQQHYHLYLHHQQPTSRITVPAARVLSPITLSSFIGSRIDHGVSHGLSAFRSASSISPVCEIAVDGLSNAAAFADAKLETNAPAEEVVDPLSKGAAIQEATAPSFMTDVANLVKLVDSRDIVELELKHLDYKILIRKKEALPSTSAGAQYFSPPQVVAHNPYPVYATPPSTSAAPSPPTPTSAPNPASASSTPAPTLEHSPMLSPMAGTFYRSPAPGEPAFVKVGDKVQKGQVVCIVEAMKLMNEIEVDQSGTIVGILVDDGKPVSIDTPLFTIKP